MKAIVQIITATLLSWCAFAGEPPLKMVPERRAFFAEQPDVLTFNGNRLPRGAHRATVEILYAGRAVIRRELKPALPLTVNLTFPHLRPGVVADSTIIVSILDRNNRVLTRLRQPVWFYSKDLLQDRRAEFKRLQLKVYAPGDNKLGAALAHLGIPFETVNNLTDLSGKWVICAGIDFEKYSGIMAEMQTVVAGGTSVLLLPPFSGRTPVQLQKLKQMVFADRGHIRYFDKRLDTARWHGRRNIAPVGCRLTTIAGDVGFETGANGRWDYVELRQQQARLVICGWDLVKYHKVHPAPAVILTELLLNQQTKLGNGKE